MSTEVTGIFRNVDKAESAVSTLVDMGIPRQKISVLMSDEVGRKNFKVKDSSKAPEGVATGAVAGGAIGAIAGGLTAVGTVTMTGGVGLLAAGPLVAALAGGGAGAGVGGLVGGLIGSGMTENEAKIVEKNLSAGSVLIGVESPDDMSEKVKETFVTSGAESVTRH